MHDSISHDEQMPIVDWSMVYERIKNIDKMTFVKKRLHDALKFCSSF